MSNPGLNAFTGGPPLIPQVESKAQLVPQSNLSPNDQLFLSNPALGRALPSTNGVTFPTKEVVDLYVVKYPEGMPGSGNNGGIKYMVIESQMPPKYHKILTTFLRTPLHYEVNPQQPTVTFSNREKALAMLKDSTLVAYTAQMASSINAPAVAPLPPQPNVDFVPPFIAPPFETNQIPAVLPAPNGTLPVVPGIADAPGGRPTAPSDPNRISNGGTPSGAQNGETDNGMDFGGFFPAGTSFIADDVVFIAENESGDRKSVTPSSANTRPEPKQAPAVAAAPKAALPSGVQSAAAVPAVPTAVLAAQPTLSAPLVIPAPVKPASDVIPMPPVPAAAPPAKQESVPMEVVPQRIAKAETVAVVPTAPQAIPVPPAPPVAAPLAPVAVEPAPAAAEEMEIIAPADQTAAAVAAGAARDPAPRAVIPSPVPIDASAPSAAPKTIVKVEGVPSSTRINPAVDAAPVLEVVKPQAVAIVIKEEPAAPKPDSAKPTAASEMPPPAAPKPPASSTQEQKAGSKKRTAEAAPDKGMKTWKKRCLTKTDQAWPTLDEATDLFRNIPFSTFDAAGNAVAKADSEHLKRENVEAKDVRALIASLTHAAKSIQKKSKSNGKDSGSGEVSGQSMWGDDESAEHGESNGGAGTDSSGKAQVEWVQCDACKKWRTLPTRSHPKYPSSLDEDKGWICSMNSWAPHLANCQVPEESMLSPTAIKIRVWLRRIRTGDRYETRNNLKPTYDKKTAGTTNIKSVPVDWIRCCSPVCGKWRACLRTMNGEDVKNVQFPWFCWMGSWDETKATCSAPQEGFAAQGYNAALTEAVDKSDNSSPAHAAQSAAAPGPSNNSALNGGTGGARRAGQSRNDGGAADDVSNEADTADGAEDDETQTTIGISSRGRIVRSKFNVKKHLANSKKAL